jgi:hypothetical protein
VHFDMQPDTHPPFSESPITGGIEANITPHVMRVFGCTF